MINMGDWAKGYFVNDLNLYTMKTLVILHSREQKVFVVITDTFGLPKGIENRMMKKFLTCSWFC